MESKFPRLIVFDFHGTLALRQGLLINDIKKELKKYKLPDEITNWYLLMNRAKINPEKMMPTLDNIIYFFDYIENQNIGTIFAITSMIESDYFIIDMMKYSFEIRGKISPFTSDTVVGSFTLNKYGGKEIGKLKHLSVIFNNLNLKLPSNEIAVIDDDDRTIEIIDKHGMCGVSVKNYFTVADWNKNSCGYEKIPCSTIYKII